MSSDASHTTTPTASGDTRAGALTVAAGTAAIAGFYHAEPGLRCRPWRWPRLHRCGTWWCRQRRGGLTFTAVTACAYLAGVRRVTAKGRRWPRSRTCSFLGGLAVIAFAAFGGLARYDDVLFSAHTVQHVLLGMVGPVFLALGAPLTLALQASGRGGGAPCCGLLGPGRAVR